jgi:ankyrin repeat protein
MKDLNIVLQKVLESPDRPDFSHFESLPWHEKCDTSRTIVSYLPLDTLQKLLDLGFPFTFQCICDTFGCRKPTLESLAFLELFKPRILPKPKFVNFCCQDRIRNIKDINVLRALYEKIQFDLGPTFLHACAIGHWEMVHVCLNRGVNINYVNTNGKTGLHLAVRQNHENVVYGLIGRGADCHIPDRFGRTAYTYCELSFVCSPDIRTAVLKNFPPAPKEAEAEALVELWTHLIRESDAKTVQYYVEIPIRIDFCIEDMIMLAVSLGKVDILKYLQSKFYHDFTDKDGLTPLERACILNQLAVVKYFLEDLKVAANLEHLFEMSCLSRQFEIAEYLLDNEIEQIDSNCNTLLQVAVMTENVDLVNKVLSKPGVDVNFPGTIGMTPLMGAFDCMQYDIVKTLLLNGANLFATTDEKKTVLDFAKNVKGDEIIRIVFFPDDKPIFVIRGEMVIFSDGQTLTLTK